MVQDVAANREWAKVLEEYPEYKVSGGDYYQELEENTDGSEDHYGSKIPESVKAEIEHKSREIADQVMGKDYKAYKDGFDISVKGNTDLKGAVIDSNAPAEKNQLTTGTLTWEDQQNKADYKASGAGVSYAGKDAPLNAKGLTPSIAPTVKGNADSTTKSAVAEGTVTITNTKDQKQNVSDLNRDTKNTLNKLHAIFDKDKVQEKQEFIGLLTKDVNEAIHKVADKNNWADGSKEKTTLHALASGILAEMSGAGFSSGALAGGVNEYVIGYLSKTKGEAWMVDHPDEVQWLSTIIGGAVNQAIGGDVATGAGSALTGTKWNYYGFEIPQEKLIQQTLKKKDGTSLSPEEARELQDEIQKIAYKIDPSEKDYGDRLVIGEDEAINTVKKSLLDKGYTTDSVEHYIVRYKNLVNQINNETPDPLRPVQVWANGEKAGEIIADAAKAGKEVTYPLKAAGTMFDLAEIMRSEYPKDEAFAMGSGKFSAAIVGTVILGAGNKAGVDLWITYLGSGTAAWGTEEFVKSYFEEKIKEFHQKNDHDDKVKQEKENG